MWVSPCVRAHVCKFMCASPCVRVHVCESPCLLHCAGPQVGPCLWGLHVWAHVRVHICRVHVCGSMYELMCVSVCEGGLNEDARGGVMTMST